MLFAIAALGGRGCAGALRLQIRPAPLDCPAGETARIKVEGLLLDHIGRRTAACR